MDYDRQEQSFHIATTSCFPYKMHSCLTDVIRNGGDYTKSAPVFFCRY